MTQLRIGLLGGSFNPPHAGHRHISIAILKQLQLDQLWWLVSPKNPLKSATNLLPLAKRLALSKKLTRHPFIRVIDLEKYLPTNYTVDTVQFLQKHYPHYQFFWIMGADNLVSFHRWKHWKTLFYLLPLIVYDRNNDRYRALASKAAQCFKKFQKPYRQLQHFPSLPVWSFMTGRLHTLSSTALRKSQLNHSGFNSSLRE